MTKKNIRVIVVVLMIATILSTAAFASGPAETKTPTAQQMYVLDAMVDSVNNTIGWMVSVAQATPYNDVNWLQAGVSAVTAPVFSYANQIGATVVCVYTTYYIDGQYVPVDPLMVIN